MVLIKDTNDLLVAISKNIFNIILLGISFVCSPEDDTYLLKPLSSFWCPFPLLLDFFHSLCLLLLSFCLEFSSVRPLQSSVLGPLLNLHTLPGHLINSMASTTSHFLVISKPLFLAYTTLLSHDTCINYYFLPILPKDKDQNQFLPIFP